MHGHAIPHFKADIWGKLNPRDLECGGIFILCYPLFKIALLVHTEGFGQFVSLSSVIICNTIHLQNTICRLDKPAPLYRSKMNFDIIIFQ